MTAADYTTDRAAVKARGDKYAGIAAGLTDYELVLRHAALVERMGEVVPFSQERAEVRAAEDAVEDELLRRLQQVPGPAPTVTVLASTIHRALTEAGVPVLLVRDSIHAARAVAKLLP